MKTIRVVLDTKLLRAVNHAAKRAKISRSALIRRALREYLKCLKIKELEERERRGYERIPDDPTEVESWERVAVWPGR